MDRRRFNRQLAWAVAASSPLLARAQQKNTDQMPANQLPTNSRWQAIEAGAAGRLGVAVLDTASGRLEGHRLDERFPMCSTFKWLAAACVLQRVDAGQERLDRRIRYGREVLLSHSPVTAQHTGQGMTLGELCEAAVTVSDNAAANLLLASFGGPAALTRYARTLGDPMTRLDRREPALNEARPGDPRDTTTPRAMATALRAAVLGEALSPASRAQLVRWLEATSTNGQRLRADLPAGWRMGSKTGSGARGTTNDVGVFWPPGGRAPLVVAVYLTESAAAESVRNAAVAQVAGVVRRGG
ncbi:class A beta-lactamase [Variovorax terrae]|uniref:Beta-lactamase n=1 Tax=Variovorax terrae TaxID=2923278 RepID=A0A9X2AL82_9BURK|nr:class A beta-lactamase [Variovorax terrae]MCJ0762438.1 class A beta-lactamase [Variovorax terrae]